MQETQSGFQGHARVFLGKLFWQVGGKIVLAGGKIVLAGGKIILAGGSENYFGRWEEIPVQAREFLNNGM